MDLRMIQRPSFFHWKTQPITRAHFLNLTTAVQILYKIMQATVPRLEAVGIYGLQTGPTQTVILMNALATPTLCHLGNKVTHFWQEKTTILQQTR